MELPYGSIRALGLPDNLLFAERSMWFARHYISSSFSTGLWSLSQNSDTSLLDQECVRLDRWYNNFGPGLDLLHAGKIAKAFEIFMRCFAATEQIIEPQDPRVVIYICQQAIRLMWYDNHGRKLSQTLLKYVSALCKKLFSDRHPLFIIMDQLGRMDNFQFAKSIPALMECYFDHLEPFLEQSSTAFRFLNDLRGLTISIMEGTKMIGMYEAMPMLEGLVKRAEDRGHACLHVRLEISAMLMRGRFFDEAVAMLLDLCKQPATRADPYEYTYANLILMLTYRKMKDSDGVINVGYNMVDYLQSPPKTLAENERDFTNELWAANYRPCTAIIFGKLEMELREVGRTDEADRVKARLDIIMDEEYGINEDTKQQSEKDLEEGVAAFGREQPR
jgi:hypothetical protein